MKDTRWQRAKEIFDEARGLVPGLRSSFIDTACFGDDELKTEVEILLTSYKSDFMEDTAFGAADLLIEPDLIPGQVIGRYRIGELIGTGGMGQVFRAEDTELDRPVAFKVLHEEVAGDQERVRRFIQEARAASALNHPNIITIHEIGSFEGARFIVSEYVDGETLRERMRHGLTSVESIDIMCQIATALQAAHSAGIVHRDIKPENIMLRQDGLVKVLDFGLAKLTEADDLPIDAKAPLSRMQTSPGLIMGTVAYMSPEQARGQAVDSRTDLWSLGVVFHEMLTGESPFKGESVTDLVTSILNYDAASPDLKAISQELKPICSKALARDKKARYQTAQDLLQDLQGEKKRMEYAIQPTPYITVSSTDELKTQIIRRRPTLSAEYIVTGIKRHKLATLVVLTLVTVLAAGLSVYRFNGKAPTDPGQNLAAINDSTTERDLKFSKLPILGDAVDGIVISPDGKYVAYMPSGRGLRLLELATSVDTEISNEGDDWAPRFAPDSKFVYYSLAIDSTDAYQFRRVSIKGGPPVKVPANPDSFSRDGSIMAFTRKAPDGQGVAVMVADADGSNERMIAKTGPNPIGKLIFSPDGKTLACKMRFKDENGPFTQLIGFSVADGKQQVLNDRKWDAMMGEVWLPNGNLVVVAREKYSDPLQLWSVSPGGQPRAITSGFVSYRALSATLSGDVLLTQQVSDVDARDLWVVPGNDATKARPVTKSGEVRGRIALTPDGRIVMGSDVAGNPDLWIMNTDGSGRKQLTNDPGQDVQPAVSPDGKYIAFTSNRVKSVKHLFLMNIDGSNLKQLTNGDHEQLASFSPDGKWVYFIDGQDWPWKYIRKVSINGGDSTVVATAPDGWSLNGIDVNRADGRLVYGLSRWLNDGWQNKLGILPTKGEAKLIDVPATFSVERPRWAPDNRTVALMSRVSGGQTPLDVWSVPVDGNGKPRQLTDFRTPGSADPRWTADGKQLFVDRGTSTSIPVLIRSSGN